MTGGVVVDPDSTAQRVSFRITTSEFLYGLTVETCDGARTMWVLGTSGTESGTPAKITYGEAPPGYVTREGPRPLTPGCYRVIVSGPASARFILNADGTVASPRASRAPSPSP